MYDEQLERLIEMALVDGQLTEKKKQVLFKKAESLGIDLDEFEMVLDARAFERNKQQTKSTQTTDNVVSIASTPDPIQVLSPINQLIKQLNDVEDKLNLELQAELDKRREERGKLNAKNVVNAVKEFIPGSSLLSIGKTLMGNEDLSDEEKDEELREKYETKIREKKKETISNFMLPDSKEVVLEFLSVSVYNSTNKTNQQNGLGKAWKEKSLQIINKYRVTFSTDNSFVMELEKYNQEINQSKGSLFGKIKGFLND